MRVPIVAPIELTPTETQLAAELKLNSQRPGHDHGFKIAGTVSLKLMESLLARQAIPEIRLRYFTEPEFNIGGRGRSRKQVFEDNGTRGTQIFQDANFLKHLRYFVYGPELPAVAIARFREQLDGCQPVTSGDIIPMAALALQLSRQIKPKLLDVAENFFKLALECGLTLSQSRLIRDRVMRRSK